jgi:hypothetical protein
MSSMWPSSIDEEQASHTIVKNESADHDDEDNSNLSHGTIRSTSSSSSSTSIHSRSSAPNTSTQTNYLLEQATQPSSHQLSNLPLANVYSDASGNPSSLTEINHPSSNGLQNESFPIPHGSFDMGQLHSRRKTRSRVALGSSSFPEQFIRTDAAGGALIYSETSALYNEVANNIDTSQSHAHQQKYSHLQQCQLFFSCQLNSAHLCV